MVCCQFLWQGTAISDRYRDARSIKNGVALAVNKPRPLVIAEQACPVIMLASEETGRRIIAGSIPV